MDADRNGPPGMPRWLKVGGGVVLALVLLALLAAALTGGEHGPGRHAGGGGHDEASPVAPGALVVNVTARSFAFEPGTITVPAGGDVAIALTSLDALHDLNVDALGAHVAAEAGETRMGGFRADAPGRFAYYCSEPGHREAGMEGTLIVRPAPAPEEPYP